MKLTEIIRKIRNCKTQSEERSLIVKESASIREDLGSQSFKKRAQNVAKLIYFHTMGYPTHFGQMEAINLMGVGSYNEKRIGYLALNILLDENQEVLPLIEHSLKKDLEDPSQFVKSLALTALANIGSEDICRNCSAHCEEMLLNTPPNLLKKVILCASRICTKCPDLVDHYTSSKILTSLLKSSNHGVVIATVSFLSNLVHENKKHRISLRKHLPTLVVLIQRAVDQTYSMEYNVNGICDPFMIIKSLELLKLLGEGSVKASADITDILATVANSVDKGKSLQTNTVAAILYECVNTILNIEAEKGLFKVATSVLGKFVKTKNNCNLRSIALTLFKTVISNDAPYVKKHGDVIVNCLKSADESIRKRAAELIYEMVDENNIKFLIGELIDYLQHLTTQEDPQHTRTLTAKIFQLVSKYTPKDSANPQWKVNTFIRVLLGSGYLVEKEVPAGFMKFVTQLGEEDQVKTVRKLYQGMVKIYQKPHLIYSHNITVQVSFWGVGEYGDLLLRPNSKSKKIAKSVEVVSLVSNFVMNTETSTKTKMMGLMCLLKLSERIPRDGDYEKAIAAIKSTFLKFKHYDKDLEIQQRANLFVSILTVEASIKTKLLERMPVIEDSSDEEDSEEDSEEDTEAEPSNPILIGEETTTEFSLDNLLNFSIPETLEKKEIEKTPEKTKDQVNLLPVEQPKEIPSTETASLLPFGNVTEVKQPPKELTEKPKEVNILDLFANVPVPVKKPVEPVPILPKVEPVSMEEMLMPVVSKPKNAIEDTMKVFEDSDMMIEFVLSKNLSQPQITMITAYYTNKTMTDFSELDFKLSVPPYLKRLVDPPSNTVLKPVKKRGVSQVIKIKNDSLPKKRIILKFRLQYKRKDSGETVVKIQPIKNIPMRY